MVVVRANALTGADDESNRVLASSTMPVGAYNSFVVLVCWYHAYPSLYFKLDVFPSSFAVRQTRRIALLLPLMLGFLTEETIVSTRLFDGYIENGVLKHSSLFLLC